MTDDSQFQNSYNFISTSPFALPEKRYSLSQANLELFDSTNLLNRNGHSLTEQQPRSRASSFGSATSGLSHPPRFKTRPKKVVSRSFSQLLKQARKSNDTPAVSFYKPGILEENYQNWKSQLQHAELARSGLDQVVNRWELELEHARVRGKDLIYVSNQLVHARLDRHEYHKDMKRLKEQLGVLGEALIPDQRLGHKRRNTGDPFRCPWEHLSACGHPRTMSEVEYG